ncbi:MAG TPA: hypothetical protein VFC95_04365 [Guyparkeria sp.]|nr:hypothetical protein [Guyparkeria sp.]
MQNTKTGAALALTAATVLMLGLAGCSGAGNSPRAEFVAACIDNSDDAAGCECIADRLEDEISAEEFSQLAEFMASDEEDLSDFERGQMFGDPAMQQLMAAAKQCEAGQ